MASSDDDSEYFDASPEVVVPRTRRGDRRKSDTSPNSVPKKKQREILSDFNVELDDSNDSDDEPLAGRKKKTATPVVGRSKAKIGRSIGAESDGSSVQISVRKTDEAENRPPASKGVPMDVPEDCEPSGSARPRARNRLSIRSSDASGVRRVSTTSSTAESLTTPSEVQNIYQTCSQMFNANRINAQNAFNLRLLDCINQMINSPTYDKTNMQLTSSTVEIGTKIYVCRVDNTHSQVLSLASDISLQQRRKKKDGQAGEGDAEANGQDANMVDEQMDEDDDRRNRQKQKKKPIKKRGKFVEEDNAKLLTGLEEQNVKFVTRRNFLQKKFNEMIYDDLDFDYLGYFLEAGEEHPLQTQEEMEKLDSKLLINDVYSNVKEMGRLDFLPFAYLPKFDPETHTIWGRPLNATEEMRDNIWSGPDLPMNEEFAYDPAERPAEYPDEAGPDNLLDDTMGGGMHHFGDDDEGGIPPVSFHDIRSLDHLDEYFQRVRSVLKDSKSKYGWCGPNFVRPKSTWTTNLNKPNAGKQRVRKEAQPFDFLKINWNEKANKYNTNTAARTVYDDRIIESWGTQKVVVPFLGIELTSYDDEFDPLDFENENDPKYVPTIFKLFTSRNRSIIELLKSKSVKAHLSGISEAPNLGDEGFDDDHDIELPRDMGEDFCSQPTDEGAFHPADGATPAEAGWQFPASVPGLLSDDPLSLVSGFDSIRFSRKPKPINMSNLKKSILATLTERLDLDGEGHPVRDEVTRIDLADLMFWVLRKIGEKTEKLMSVPIFIVALMHVVADKRLFVEYVDSDPDCPYVFCKGKNFDHKKHIPMPKDGFDD